MAVLISKATGNLTAAGTWAPVEAGASAQQSTHSTSQTIAGNANASTPSFTGTNTDQCDGVLLWVQRGGVTGTVLVELQKGGVTQASVTVNNSDLPAAKSPVFFKFSGSHTFDGSATYTIKVSVSSGGSTLTIYRDATSSNFAKQLRLTAAASAPAAADVFVVVGELTGAGTSNAFTVTMESDGTTTFGTNTQTVATVPHTTQNGCDIGVGGTLQWATATGTYRLQIKGHVGVWSGGTMSMGTSGTPVPSGVMADLYFENDAVVKFGLELLDGHTLNLYGLNKTHMQYLDADAAAAATSLTLNAIPTNWQNNDEIAIASTSRTNSESEVRTLNANVSTTTATVSAGLTNAHKGGQATNGPLVKAEVINVTRNVRVRGHSTNYAYVYIQAGTANCNWQYAEFKHLGSATTNKQGLNILPTAGTFAVLGCVVRDSSTQTSALGFFFQGTSGLNYSVTYCVGWSTGNTFFTNVGTTATGWVVDNCVSIRTFSSNAFTFNDAGGTVTNLTVAASSAFGFSFQEGNVWGTVSNLISHSNANSGVAIGTTPGAGSAISNVLAYRNSTIGFDFTVNGREFSLTTCNAFGNTNAGMRLIGGSFHSSNFIDVTLDAGLVLTQPVGLQTNPSTGCQVANVFYNAQIGVNQAHSTADLQVASSLLQYQFVNSKFGSTTEISSQSSMWKNSRISSAKHDQAAGNHKTWKAEGTISTDTTLADVSPAARLTPLSASLKLECEVAAAEVANSNTVTFSVKVRKSAAGDGATYNGAQPRLILKRNDAAGITADTVLATATNAANGAWETIQGTTAAVTDDAVLVVVVDCDGTAGWVNFDTASAS